MLDMSSFQMMWKSYWTTKLSIPTQPRAFLEWIIAVNLFLYNVNGLFPQSSTFNVLQWHRMALGYTKELPNRPEGRVRDSYPAASFTHAKE